MDRKEPNEEFDPINGTTVDNNTKPDVQLVRQARSDISDKPAAFAAAFVQRRTIRELKELYDLDGGMTLGRGSYGCVTAVRRRSDNAQFALKMIKIGGESDATLQEIRNEIAIQKRLDHPNIAKIYESFEDPSHNLMYIVMEICTGGTLVSRMKHHRHGYGEKAAATIMEEVFSAILYCHNHGVVHRDIKLDNMIFLDQEDDSELKVIDFGFANLVRPGREGMFEQLGTPSYMAPELWERDDSKAYTAAVDVWALGVCAYMLLSGTKPFYHRDMQQRRWLIRHAPLEFPHTEWEHISAEAKDFCKQLLEKKPSKRPSASEALAHPWIQKRSELRSGLDASQELAKHERVVEALESFADADDLKRLSLEVIAFNSPTSTLEELRAIFHKMDTDNSGTISLPEFKRAMVSHPELSERRVEQIFSQMDLSGGGEVNYNEFIAATISSQNKTVHQVDAPSIKSAFHIIDTDHDGFITQSDLQRTFGKQLDPAAMKRIVDKVDSRTNRINFEQFHRIMLAENRYSDEVAKVLKKEAIAHAARMSEALTESSRSVV